jgi:two-component system NtrC family sensor kinase
VLTARSGPEALRLLQENSVHVLFADQRMPPMSGIQLLEKVARAFPETMRVLVTGYADIDVVIDAINRGSVYRYLSKPWEADEVAATVRNALEVISLRQANRRLIASLDEQNRLLLRTVDELRFLNQLEMDLKGLRDADSVVKATIERLKATLGATGGCYWQRDVEGWRCRLSVPPPGFDPGLLEGLEGAQVLAAAEGGGSYYLLPLAFAQNRFGVLAFSFDLREPLDPSERLFAQAASHVASSALYTHHVHDEERRREQLALIGQTASMIVHDLKGPLATIMGFVSLLQADLDEERRREFGGIINEEVSRLIQMVEELLSFSQGKPRLELAPVGAADLVGETVELFRFGFEKEGIRAELSVDPAHVIFGDRRKLKKVLINLLQNARDFLRDTEGDRLLRVYSAREGSAIRIGVVNSGPTLSADVASRIFDPFFSYRKDEGTGLGLTICKQIVEEHGGSISMHSQDGLTEFLICLPTEPAAHPV